MNMYLPHELPKAQVLVTVKTYPQPSSKYGELVCTAGILPDGKWIRIYPIPFRTLSDDHKYRKYSIIELDLIRKDSDFRLESYRPAKGPDEDIKEIRWLDTASLWQARKEYILREVFTSMNELIRLAKGSSFKSLGTLKPTELIGFEIEEDEREWKDKWLFQAQQGNIFETNSAGGYEPRDLIRKLPYKYSYKFLSKDDTKPRKLQIHDWEIGSLFWKCLKQTEGDEKAANGLVKKKYFEEFLNKKDLYLFLGTTKEFHNVSPDPFIIAGVFYPPVNPQMSLFVPKIGDL